LTGNEHIPNSSDQGLIPEGSNEVVSNDPPPPNDQRLTINDQRFSKEERLCSKKIIQEIFSGVETKKTNHYPLMAVWKTIELPSTFSVQVLFSVPKKKFKKAHDRNRLRRQLKESYRLQKKHLYENLYLKRLQCAVVMVYIAKEKESYQKIDHACSIILKNIAESAQ
jgi:ribonuclease P protein component